MVPLPSWNTEAMFERPSIQPFPTTVYALDSVSFASPHALEKSVGVEQDGRDAVHIVSLDTESSAKIVAIEYGWEDPWSEIEELLDGVQDMFKGNWEDIEN